MRRGLERRLAWLSERVGCQLEVWYEPRDQRGGAAAACVITAVVDGRRYHLYRAGSEREATRATAYAGALVELLISRQRGWAASEYEAGPEPSDQAE